MLVRWRVGLSVEDGKKITAVLQTAVVSHEADTYTLFLGSGPSTAPSDGQGLYDPPHQDRLRTVEVRNPRWRHRHVNRGPAKEE
jgi:hypothetical protein